MIQEINCTFPFTTRHVIRILSCKIMETKGVEKSKLYKVYFKWKHWFATNRVYLEEKKWTHENAAKRTFIMIWSGHFSSSFRTQSLSLIISWVTHHNSFKDFAIDLFESFKIIEVSIYSNIFLHFVFAFKLIQIHRCSNIFSQCSFSVILI